MSTNIIESYLVSLGFKHDEPSLRKFGSVLDRAEGMVDGHTSGMLQSVLKVQTGILGAFTAMSGAILGVAERASMADQSYRLLGQRMLMTTDSARKMDTITKALGASMGEIIWDPELHARAEKMSEAMDRMTAQEGPGFSARLKQVRDVRAEFAGLGIVVQELERQFTVDLVERLGGLDTVRSKLDSFLKLAQKNLPKIADGLASDAMPILKATQRMFYALGGTVQELGVAFTNTVASVSGHGELKAAEFKWQNFSSAVELSIRGVSEAAGWFEESLFGIETRLISLYSKYAPPVLSEMRSLFLSITDSAEQAALGAIHFIGVWTGDKSLANADLNLQSMGQALVHVADGFKTVGREAGLVIDSLTHLAKAEQYVENKQWKAAAIEFRSAVDPGFAAKQESDRKQGEQWALSQDNARRRAERAGRDIDSSILAGDLLGKSNPVDNFPQGQGDVLSAIAKAMARQEGGNTPGTLGYRNNNPLNLMYVGQKGAKRGEGGFAKYDTYEQGLQADVGQISLDAKRGHDANGKPTRTLAELIESWAPSSDPRNNTATYIENVSKWTGIQPNASLLSLMAAAGQDRRITDPASNDGRNQDALAYLQRAPVSAAQSTPQGANVQVRVGDIHVTKSDGDPRDIQDAVRRGVLEGLNSQVQFDMVQIAPAW